MSQKIFIVRNATSLLRRTSSVTVFLLLLCLNGCSQNDHHNFNQPSKIPIDTKRWYLLNNASYGFDQLFNNKQYENPNVGYGMLLEHFDAWYPLLDGEQMTIDSIMMFDWEGTNEDHPMTIYAVTDKWERIVLATFTGQRYGAWNGPDPKKPDVYALNKTIAGIRYLVINSWGNFPGEIEFYGSYIPPKVKPVTLTQSVPLKYFFGVNAFEWDFEEPNDPFNLDVKRLVAISNFTGIRHYLDWDKIEEKEGLYTFSPASSGGWNYDTIYQWCQVNHLDVVACLKTIPPWIQETYPADERDNENIPIRYGKKADDPMSYMEQAKAGFQFAARYGRNKSVTTSLIKLRSDNQLRIGLGTVQYIECDNERDKWWKGRKAYQTGREHAANLSAFYDGHKNTMGPGAGVRNADSSMKVVMAGLAKPDPDYIRGMIDWCREFRGYKPGGGVDLPWDIVNYHYYCNDADYVPDKKQTTGVAPELTRASAIADEFVRIAQQHNMPVWITEAGYDLNPESPQAATPVNGKSAPATQADWLLRTSLLYSRSRIQKVFYYELVDDNPKISTQYATSGLINTDRTARPVADYFRQTNALFGEFAYRQTISRDPIVDKYENGLKMPMYMLVVPDQKGRQANYTLSVGSADTAYIYTPRAGSNDMDMTKLKTNKGSVDITVSETPKFVTPYRCK